MVTEKDRLIGPTVRNESPHLPEQLIILFFGYFLADIDDTKICYVLRDGANATSDMFHFTVEDGGKYALTYQYKQGERFFVGCSLTA